LHQIKYSFAQAIEILPKISAFKHYYLRQQELVFYVLDTATYIAVKWRIPTPNSSSSFEVSAIFGMVISMTLVARLGIYGITSRNFISTSVVRSTG